MTLRTYLLRIVLIPIIFLGLAFFLLFNDGPLNFLYETQPILVLSILFVIALLLGILSALFLSEKIKMTLLQLQENALTIAAGDYKESISVKGPEELVDLAKSMNTMSDCLQETLSRLRESAVLRERMYGEYECGLLLQYYMLEKVLDQYHNPQLAFKALSYTTASTLHGVLLTLKNNPSFQLSFQEAIEGGFAGIYHLLTNEDHSENQWLSIQNENGILKYESKNMPRPIFWSTETGQEISLSVRPAPKSQDVLIIYNWGLARCFEEESQLTAWFHKVLKHFASEGFDLCMTMFQHELNFLTKKQKISRDIHLICFQFK